MKNLFTYPSNPSTNYIDPNYVGNATSGMTRRIDDLLDGTYKSWEGLDPIVDLSATTPDIESNISKFINSYVSLKHSSNVGMYDFWNLPLLSCTMKLIDSVNVLYAVYNFSPTEETIFTTAVEHEFTNGQLLLLNNFNDQMTDYNGDTFYVKVLTPTTLQLAYNSDLTNLLIVGDNITGTFSTIWQTKSQTPYGNPTPGGGAPTGTFNYNPDTFRIDMNTFVPDPNNDPLAIINDATPVRINTVQYNGADLATNTYYTKAVGNLEYELYTDQALTTIVNGSDLTGNTNRQISARITSGFDKTVAQSAMTWTTGGQILQCNSTDLAHFTADIDNRWVSIPYSQQQQSFTGFVGGPTVFWQYQIEYTDITLRTDGQFEIGQLYVNSLFNNYRRITNSSATPNQPMEMEFASDVYDIDPLTTAYPGTDWDWEILTTTDWIVAKVNDWTWHSLPIFDGFHFDNFTRLSSYNQPHKADIINQPGLPVLDPVSSTLTFSDAIQQSSPNPSCGPNGPEVWFVNLSKSFYLPPGYDPLSTSNPRFFSEDGIMNVVVWKPGINLDDYRMSFDEYGLLNIMEKDGSNNWTVPIYALFERDDPTSPNYNSPWLAPVCNWAITEGGVGSPCFIAQTEYVGLTNTATQLHLYPNAIATSGGAGSYTPNRGVINLKALQQLWPDLNLTTTSSLDVTVSPCPYEIGTPTTVGFFRKLWDGPLGVISPTNTVGHDPNFPLLYATDYKNNSLGIPCADTNIQQAGFPPCQFVMSNKVTATLQTTGDVNAEFLFNGLNVASAGELAVDTSEPLKYEVSSIDLKLPGNTVYTYQDTNNQPVFGARIDPDKYWRAGEQLSQAYATQNELAPTIAVTVDSNGRLASATLTETPTSEGLFATGDNILLPMVPLADTYVPPVLTTAEQADVWDTDDEWADYGLAGGLKRWPNHVSPSNATVNYRTPTIVNNSQNGIKYTRSTGFTKWTLDVEYPPMQADDFREFSAIAQAAQGQAMPFYFMLRDKNDNSILWSNFGETGTSAEANFNQPVSIGNTTALLEGFAGNEQNALQRGEVFLDGNNENGYLHTAVNTVNANAFGEAKIRIAMPAREAQAVGEKIYKDPEYVTVTLSNDNFEYSVDTAGFYYVSVSFDLDDWK